MFLETPHHEPSSWSYQTLVKEKNRVPVTSTSWFKSQDKPGIEHLTMKILHPHRLNCLEAEQLLHLVDLCRHKQPRRIVELILLFALEAIETKAKVPHFVKVHHLVTTIIKKVDRT